MEYYEALEYISVILAFILLMLVAKLLYNNYLNSKL